MNVTMHRKQKIIDQIMLSMYVIPMNYLMDTNGRKKKKNRRIMRINTYNVVKVLLSKEHKHAKMEHSTQNLFHECLLTVPLLGS